MYADADGNPDFRCDNGARGRARSDPDADHCPGADADTLERDSAAANAGIRGAASRVEAGRHRRAGRGRPGHCAINCAEWRWHPA